MLIMAVARVVARTELQQPRQQAAISSQPARLQALKRYSTWHRSATPTPAHATKDVKQTTSIDSLKLYAHSRIINYEQFNCFHSLISKESNWRIDARNGSHYGLGQMRNAKYGRLDGFSMVDWSIRYIKGRYGSMCNAWRFFKVNGYH